MPFGFLKKALKKVAKVPGLNVATAGFRAVTDPKNALKHLNPVNIAKSELKNSVKFATKALPIAKPVAGGLAMVFPPVGVPLAAGVAVADRVVAAYNSANPATKASAKRIVARTQALAKGGDVGAQRAYHLMTQRTAAMTEARKWKLQRSGRVQRSAA